MITIKNTHATSEIIKEQAYEVLTTYEAMSGRRTIRKYNPQDWQEIPHNKLCSRHYEPADVDLFITAFEDEMGLEPHDNPADLEAEIHEQRAANNYINPVTAFKLCLKYWLDLDYWD